MIKHTELRCGNLVSLKYDGKTMTAKVTSVKEHYIEMDVMSDHYVFSRSNPADVDSVPLSEEWLIRAGFGESHNGWYKSPIASAFDYIGEKTTGIWVVMDMESPEIKWVHQLQNLVFALTGEELTFKDL